MSFTIVEKPIPELPEARGVPDPRVRYLWREGAKKAEATGQPVRPAAPPTQAQVVANVRASMGWDNLDLTHGTVESQPMTFAGRSGSIETTLTRPLAAKGLLPCVVYFHGGGFMGGKPSVLQNPCRLLAERAGAVVINVDYRLAPEFPFPTGLEDCFDVVKAVHQRAAELGVDPKRVVVAGDSAGGNLSAACCVVDSQQGTHLIAAQLLLYPAVDLRSEGPNGHLAWSLDDYDISAHPEVLTPAVLGLKEGGPWFTELYVAGQSAAQPLVSPILHDPAKFPPTLVLTAEYDFLRVEGEEFARRLHAAGVPVRAVRYRGQEHAYLDKLGFYPQAADAVVEMATFVQGLSGFRFS